MAIDLDEFSIDLIDFIIIYFGHTFGDKTTSNVSDLRG